MLSFFQFLHLDLDPSLKVLCKLSLDSLRLVCFYQASKYNTIESIDGKKIHSSHIQMLVVEGCFPFFSIQMTKRTLPRTTLLCLSTVPSKNK